MRTPGSPIVLEYRRRLAVQRVHEGYSIEEVADFLGVARSSVRRWITAFRHQGVDGLAARPVPGRPPKRLEIEPLPAHAPELMPVEQVWTWLKYDRLCTFAPEGAHQLNEVAIRELEAIRDDQARLRNFFHASDLPLPRALLT